MKTGKRNRRITRRDFLRVAGVAAGTLAAGCRLGSSPRNATPTTRAAVPGKSILYAQAKPPTPPAGTPDLILRNGKLITIDIDDTIAQAIAVKDGRIQAVGSNETIDALKGAGTQVVELNGRSLTPGLIDPHFHLGVVAAMEMYTPFLPPEVKNLSDLQKKLKEVAKQTPPGQWILGDIFSLGDQLIPNAKQLDAVAPDNPVWIIHMGGHYGAANTLALQLAGITKDTPDPAGALIERDQDGNPTGAFYNHRAMDALRKVVPAELTQPNPESLRKNQSLLVSSGVTSFQDVYVRGQELVRMLYDLGKSGDLILRGAIYPILEYQDGLDGLLKLERYRDDMFRLGGIKLQIDGQGPTAYTHQPHEGASWDMPSWEPDVFKQIVRTLHEAGMQICTHCIGDAALDLTLDAYEAAMNASPRSDPRHRIEHCILSTQESHQRIKDLDVVVSNSPTFLVQSGDYFLRNFGKERENLMFRARDWLDKDIPMALNSDYPTTFWYAPQKAMSAAVGRLTSKGQTLGADQAISMSEALRAHTMGAAYAGFDESDKGSLEPGKFADLAIWTQDPLGMTAEQMGTATIDVTYVGGKQVYPA